MLDAQRESMLDRCDELHADEPEDDCPGCEQRAQIAREDAEHEGSVHHAHVGTLHFANGWPMQLCSSCLETIDHRACLECGDSKPEGRQIHESERRAAWGDR